MKEELLTAGQEPPKDVNVVIEIPMRSAPVKYELDKDTGALFVDRFLSTAMYYPCNYGYIPKTLCDDGDPADVLVIAPYGLNPGSVVRCRPIGLLKMTDEAGGDAKILAVPHRKLSQDYIHVKSPADVSVGLLDTIAHFFEHYKDLEPNKWVKIDGWVGPEEAEAEILRSIESYHNQ